MKFCIKSCKTFRRTKWEEGEKSLPSSTKGCRVGYLRTLGILNWGSWSRSWVKCPCSGPRWWPSHNRAQLAQQERWLVSNIAGRILFTPPIGWAWSSPNDWSAQGERLCQQTGVGSLRNGLSLWKCIGIDRSPWGLARPHAIPVSLPSSRPHNWLPAISVVCPLSQPQDHLPRSSHPLCFSSPPKHLTVAIQDSPHLITGFCP